MENTDNTVPVKKKRGRKPKNQQPQENLNENIELQVPKKRGRKPKGGKLFTRVVDSNETPVEITNIILHLKCSLKDITTPYYPSITGVTYNPEIPPAIESFEESKNNYSLYNNVEQPENENNNFIFNNENENKIEDNKKDDLRLINQKLKHLKMQLYKGDIDKKSACFWCTFEFDNTACYIPIQQNVNDILGYGCFCRPECAAAYLLKENIDDSTKFERYHMLNKLYGTIYNYEKSIKPAASPYYLLDKFYGTLSIQEYRKLLKTEHMLITLDKPFSKNLPELHEENDNLVSDIYGCGNPNNQSLGMYKVKRESEKQKGPSKSAIIQNQFGLN